MPRSKSFLAILLILWVVPAHGDDLLPKEAGFTLQKIDSLVKQPTTVNTYVTQPGDYIDTVYCPDTVEPIGKLMFQDTAYTGTTAVKKSDGSIVNVPVGGAIINGGFILNSNEPPPPEGSKYGWLQYVDVTSTTNPNKDKHFVDGDPIYDDFTQSDTYAKNYTAVLFDAPARGPLGTPPPANAIANLTWLAQSALVCYNKTNMTAMVIGSFMWGFDVTTDAKTGVTSVTETNPLAFDNSVASDNAFIAKVGSVNGWKLTTGCCSSPVPEFGMSIQFSFVILGLFFVMRRARRAPLQAAE